MQGNNTFKSELKGISGEIKKYGKILLLKIISLILETFVSIYNYATHVFTQISEK